ncbi:hypothetical protein [Georgenia sp. AZ-5]|uniref:hypothetical protein n=1 Tax=Georgenia sp. AZ-5 TaxID=3367526 RepID=UPI00375509F9
MGDELGVAVDVQARWQHQLQARAHEPGHALVLGRDLPLHAGEEQARDVREPRARGRVHRLRGERGELLHRAPQARVHARVHPVALEQPGGAAGHGQGERGQRHD